MKKRAKSTLCHLLLTIAGVAIGTVASGIFFNDRTQFNDIFGAIMLSPLEMTIGIPMMFYRISTVVGLMVVFGFIIWAYSIVLRVKSIKFSNYFTIAGATLWSLGNLQVYWAYMSV